MEVQKDFKELLALFNAHRVEFLIVGGYALAYHGAPRYTGDLDVYVKPDHENAERILKALSEFGFGSVGIKETDFEHPEKIIQLGHPPVRVDIITSISGVTWDEADRGKTAGKYGGISVYFIGRDQFISNKKATARKKDFADLEALGEE
jgi:hypothetical protein